jgi:CheY-like chemotaxis protein/AraC-like DNA-binding protein
MGNRGHREAAAGRAVVLIVDDDAAVLEVLRLMLEHEYDVPTASGGAAALQILQTRPVDVVLLDLLMPGMDGLEVLVRVKELYPGLPVILVSGLVQLQAAVTGMRLGAFDYLTKPFLEEDLLALVAAAVRRRRADLGTVLLVGDEPGVLACLTVLLAPYTIVATAPLRLATLPDPDLRVPLLVLCHCPPTTVGSQLAELIVTRYPRSIGVLLTAAGDPTGRPRLTGRPVSLPDRLDAVLQYIATLVPAFPGLADRSTRMGPQVLRLLDFMARAYAEPLAMRDLAHAAGCSVHHLAHTVQDRLHMSPLHLLMWARFEVARHLLGFSPAAIDEIAEAAGFSSASHLSHVFLQRRGLRPGAYRRQMRLGGFWPPRPPPSRSSTQA